jgi:hypothetical protein
MNTYTHQTAPTQFVEANGIRFAYRRFGAPTRSSGSLTTGRSGTARPSRSGAAYFEPQAVLEKLGIKLPLDGVMNA